jgi:2-oxo-3-hexenedioate decarboxylase
VSGDEAALLERVREARGGRRTVVAGKETEVDLGDAYRIQDELGEGREVKGYKLGLVSPAKQAQIGIDSPIYGKVYPEMLLESPVCLGRFIQPKFEPELAVVLGEDLPPGAPPGVASRAAGGIFLAVDFLDSIWEGYKFSIAEMVADNTSGGGFLMGDQPLANPFEGELRLYLDGEPVAEGSLRSLEDWEERLVWLAGEVGGLWAGQAVFLGSPAAPVEVRPGTLELRGPHGSALIARLELEE